MNKNHCVTIGYMLALHSWFNCCLCWFTCPTGGLFFRLPGQSLPQHLGVSPKDHGMYVGFTARTENWL